MRLKRKELVFSMFRFENVGKSIKSFAEALGWICFLGFLLVGVFLFFGGIGNEAPALSIIGVIFAALAYPVAQLSVLFLYGMGELIENTHVLRKRFCSDEDED